MKMKDKSYSNAYLKVTVINSKSDIIVGSLLDVHSDESHNAVKLFKQVYKNCKDKGKHNTVCFDSGFNTMGTSVAFEALNVKVIAPTKEYENARRNPDN
jgi:hypothetical protein